MYEKISESPARKEKVSRVKTKILSEIDAMSQNIREDITAFPPEMNEEDSVDWNLLIAREFNLCRLREYIGEENTFMDYRVKYEEKDVIVYIVSDMDLNIWLQENYNFPFNLLCKMEEEKLYDVFPLLDDEFFGYEFTSVFDRARYEMKMERKVQAGR